MRLMPGNTYTDLLQAGNGLTMTPCATALVELTFSPGVITREHLTYPKRYGPYPCATHARITSLTAPCMIDEAEITEPLQVEGWDDLRFPVQGVNPAGAVNAPSVDTDLTGYPGTLLFSGNQDNVIAGIAQMPHAWKRDSAISPHIHWSKPTGSAAAVDWVLYYRILGSVGDAPGALIGPVSAAVTIGDPTASDEMLLTSFGDIDLTGQKESTCIAWQIRRLGDSDADNNTARLFEFDIHYQTDKSGTLDKIPT